MSRVFGRKWECRMNKSIRKIRVVAFVFFVLIVLAAATVDTAYAFGPWKPGGGGGTHSVAEPSTLLLLGTGLASLGVFAFKKRNKK